MEYNDSNHLLSGTPYQPRLTPPEPNNPYYVRKEYGGYATAILGSPSYGRGSVLSNCVGYAHGRFNEIGGYGECRYFNNPPNAENFIERFSDLPVGQTPRLGACMVWQKGATLSSADGAGHVAIVEKIISDTEIITSESGWGSSAFWTQIRKKGNGNWANSSYKFRGFIYNPAVTSDSYVVEGVDEFGSYYGFSGQQITFADLGLDESKINPFIVTVSPNTTKINYSAIKEMKVCGMMFFAGQRYEDGSHRVRQEFRATNLRKQVEDCQKAELVFALYTKVLARSVEEAKEELRQLYYTVSRYPPGLGLWLALKFPPSQSKNLNHKILDFYYERLTEYGLSKGCGLYVTPEELSLIDWDSYKDKFQLWLIKNCDSIEEADEVGTVIEPEFFKIKNSEEVTDGDN